MAKQGRELGLVLFVSTANRLHSGLVISMLLRCIGSAPVSTRNRGRLGMLGMLGTGCSASFPEFRMLDALPAFAADDGCPMVSPQQEQFFEMIWLGHYMDVL